MIRNLAWLALEVDLLERADRFYDDTLGLDRTVRSQDEWSYAAGETELKLRPSGIEPPGGAHVHFAFTTATSAFTGWLDRLSPLHVIETMDFGSFQALYCRDPDGHIVEIAGRDDSGSGLNRVFEVVLSVSELDAAVEFYTQLGMTELSRGTDRPRARLRSGNLDIELWEPHRGIADAQPGEHVDLGIRVPDPTAAVNAVQDLADVISEKTIVDPDGHRLTFVAP